MWVTMGSVPSGSVAFGASNVGVSVSGPVAGIEISGNVEFVNVGA